MISFFKNKSQKSGESSYKTRKVKALWLWGACSETSLTKDKILLRHTKNWKIHHKVYIFNSAL
jgi:hypothetical protein